MAYSGPPEQADPWLQRRIEMVEAQLQRRGITDERVLQAMLQLPRQEFVPLSGRQQAYDDSALPIGYGQTISQPYMVALMLSLLQVQPADRVLEVGAGSGYVAALLGLMAAEVYAIELVPQLAERAADTVARLGLANVRIKAGDGTLGWPEAAPFDRILVSAAAPAIPPPLVEQLVDGGFLAVPVGDRTFQTCEVSVKTGDRLQTQRSIDCVFVPLLGQHGWRNQ